MYCCNNSEFYAGMTDFDFTIIAINTTPDLDPQNDILQTFINVPHCYSGNAIIITGFNRSSDITSDREYQFRELHYTDDTIASRIPQTYERSGLLCIQILSRAKVQSLVEYNTMTRVMCDIVAAERAKLHSAIQRQGCQAKLSEQSCQLVV